MSKVTSILNTLLEGDPFAPTSVDLIVQRGYLAVGERVPEGWRVLSGNDKSSGVARIAYRYEIEEEGK